MSMKKGEQKICDFLLDACEKDVTNMVCIRLLLFIVRKLCRSGVKLYQKMQWCAILLQNTGIGQVFFIMLVGTDPLVTRQPTCF